LVRYLDHRAADTTHAVLGHELTVISRTHRAAGEESPRSHPLVREWLRNFRNNPRPPQTTAPAIQDAQLKAMVVRVYALAQQTHGTNGELRRRMTALRDRALILIGKAGALHRLDYRRLTRADVKVRRAGLELTLRRATSQGGTTKITLARVKPVVLCPVDAWQAWHSAAPADPSAPAFPTLGRHGPRNEPVEPTDTCIAVKRALHGVGIDPTLYTEESLAAVSDGVPY